MTWKNGSAELDTASYSPGLAHWLDTTMEQVAERGHAHVTENDLLAGLLGFSHDDPSLLDLTPAARDSLNRAVALLTNHLAESVRTSDCLRAFEDLAETTDQAVNPFDRAAWREPLPDLVEALPDRAEAADLICALFEAADTLPDGDLITSLFQTEAVVRLLRGAGRRRDLFQDGSLDPQALKPRAGYLLDQALTNAARAGQSQCDTVDLLAAMLRAKDSYTQTILRRAGLSVTTPKAASYFATVMGAPVSPHAVGLPATDQTMTLGLIRLLEQARDLALATSGAAVGERELLTGLLACDDPKVAYLSQDVIGLDSPLVRDLLHTTAEPDVIEPLLPIGVCPVRNASVAANAVVARDEVLTPIIQVFFRAKNRVVLLHGEHGTGATTMADVLAGAVASGRFPALRSCQVIAFDLTGVADGGDTTPGGTAMTYDLAAEKVLAFMEAEPDRIYLLEGFGPYFQSHYAQLARRLAHCAYRVVITVDVAELTELQACGAPLKTFLEPVELTEPTPAQTSAIVEQAARRLAQENGVTFDPKAVSSAIRLSGDYMLSSRFPAKAVDLLERVAADEVAEAAMNARAPRLIDRAAVARRVAQFTGLPVETVLGTGQDKDYVDLLSTNLVGQDAAVAKVAGRLDLIQKSMVGKKLPAAIFIFAGLSGTGKSELAKQIAQIYSASHAMVSFPMENYGESHSVSGLIGAPPGYTGYDEGGPLINALNRDPYSVVLLDEVEKAHPNVWDPFLNLFDEGWITDRRGVTASGARAFFVLTTNIGQYEIADMLNRGATPEEIEETVMALMPTFKHHQAGIPCFRPEFLGRVVRRGGVVAFNALSYEALLGIARQLFAKVAQDFAETHEGRFVCDDDVLEMMARNIYQENEAVIRSQRPGYMGARRLQQQLDQYVNNKLAAKIRQLAAAPLVRVVRDGDNTEVIAVFDDGEAEALLAERRQALVSRVERRFSQVVTAPDEVFACLSDTRLLRLDRLLSEVGAIL